MSKSYKIVKGAVELMDVERDVIARRRRSNRKGKGVRDRG